MRDKNGKKVKEIEKNPGEYIITCHGDFVRIKAAFKFVDKNLKTIREKLKLTGRFNEKSPEQVAKERYDHVLESVNFDYNQLHDWIYNNLDKVEIIRKEDLGVVDYQKAIEAIFKYVKESFNGSEGKWRVKRSDGQKVLINEETGQAIYYSYNIKEQFNKGEKWTVPSHKGRVSGESYDAVFIYLHSTFGHLGGACVNESKFPNVKFISPQSAKLNYDMWHSHDAAPGGEQTQGWVNVTGDIHEIKNETPNLSDIEDKVHIDYPQLKRSATYVEEIIEQEVAKGIRTERIFVGDFSSGALLTLTTALTSKHNLGGFCSLSGILPRKDKLLPIAGSNYTNKNTPIFISNFPEDNWVPQWMGKKSAELLKNNGYKNVITRFEGRTGHGYDSNDIEKFLAENLSKESREREVWEENQQKLKDNKDITTKINESIGKTGAKKKFRGPKKSNSWNHIISFSLLGLLIGGIIVIIKKIKKTKLRKLE